MFYIQQFISYPINLLDALAWDTITDWLVEIDVLLFDESMKENKLNQSNFKQYLILNIQKPVETGK